MGVRRVGEWESGGESGRVGEWESGRVFKLLIFLLRSPPPDRFAARPTHGGHKKTFAGNRQRCEIRCDGYHRDGRNHRAYQGPRT